MMKKAIFVGCSFVIFLVLFANVSFAQGPDKKWGIGARVSYYAPDDTTIEGIKFDPDESIFFEGNMTWFPMKWLSLEFTAGYTKTDIDAELLGGSLEFGELEQIPLLLTGRVHWWSNDSRLSLYGGGGIGYYINDFSLGSIWPTVIPGVSVDADDSFGFHVTAGLEYFFAENWAFNLDLKYIWNEADFDSTAPGEPTETDEIDLDAFVVGLGIKYYW